MKVGVLFSGGKDSTLALHKASEKEQVTCLITLRSKNPESYMFHTPNIEVTTLQSESLGLPLITRDTFGRKEDELKDLRLAILQAVDNFQIGGIVTGAVESVYQAQRIQRICFDLDLWCFNPLWKRDQIALLNELIEKRYQTIISGVFAYPLDEKWLGREIGSEIVQKLIILQKEYGISPSGEGGEIETTVLDAPLFRKRIRILDQSVESKGNSGVFRIKKAELIPK
jgi:diphthine-ammonia ligase